MPLLYQVRLEYVVSQPGTREALAFSRWCIPSHAEQQRHKHFATPPAADAGRRDARKRNLVTCALA
jgi:hypothetical protein